MGIITLLPRLWGWWKSRPVIGVVPSCYGSNPGPQDRAENDCIHCKLNDLCLRGPARFTKEELETL
jgi:hypothetical protein